MGISKELAFTFDDISILPTDTSTIMSRQDVDTSTMLHDIEIPMPLISASMSVFDVKDGAIYLDFARHMYHAGGLHIFSRRSSLYERTEVANELNEEGVEYGISVSLAEFLSMRHILEDLHCFVSIDIANGAILPDVSDWKGKYPLIVGNFGSPAAIKKSGGYVIQKYGLGNGSACSTRLVTGVGVPQAWLLNEIEEHKGLLVNSSPIISDGGINTVGDFCKALALGADAVMVGGLLAGAEETPGEPVKHGNRWYKPYHGEASYEAKKTKSFIEGVSGWVPYDGKSIYDLVDEFSDGLRSCMSYVGVEDLIELQRDVAFVRVSPAARKENGIRVFQSED